MTQFQLKPIHVGMASWLSIVAVLWVLSKLVAANPNMIDIVKIATIVAMCAGIYINFRIVKWQWRESVREINAELDRDTP